MFRGQAGTWDCDAWVKETNTDELRGYTAPERPPKGQHCLRGKSTCVGPRGATYIIRGGIKIYTPRGWGKPSVPISSAVRKSVRNSVRKSVKKTRKSVKKSVRKSVKKTRKGVKKSVK